MAAAKLVGRAIDQIFVKTMCVWGVPLASADGPGKAKASGASPALCICVCVCGVVQLQQSAQLERAS